MSFKRFWALFVAKNIEFFRDRGSFGWNFAFPFLIIVSFYFIFHRGMEPPKKFGILLSEKPGVAAENTPVSANAQAFIKKINEMGLAETIVYYNKSEAINKLAHHKLAILLAVDETPLDYWINESSPDGLFAERVLMSMMADSEVIKEKTRKQTVTGRKIGYIDWVFPGIVAMNIMFSSLYGVGFSVVRYRKNGMLKRLQVTPVTPFEYLAAQVVSRLFFVFFTNTIFFMVCKNLFNIHCEGSYLDLFILFCVASASLISLSLVVASRIATEELAEGLINMISMPMLFLSEIWFSLDGAPSWVVNLSKFLPLTHAAGGLRRIMNDGASITDLMPDLAVLGSLTVLFMIAGSLLFKWNKN